MKVRPVAVLSCVARHAAVPLPLPLCRRVGARTGRWVGRTVPPGRRGTGPWRHWAVAALGRGRRAHLQLLHDDLEAEKLNHQDMHQYPHVARTHAHAHTHTSN